MGYGVSLIRSNQTQKYKSNSKIYAAKKKSNHTRDYLTTGTFLVFMTNQQFSEARSSSHQKETLGDCSL